MLSNHISSWISYVSIGWRVFPSHLSKTRYKIKNTPHEDQPKIWRKQRCTNTSHPSSNSASEEWILFEMYSRPVISTHLKNASQIGSSPQVGEKTKNIWNHHLVFIHVHYGKPKAMLKRLHLQKARSHGASSFLTVPWPAPKPRSEDAADAQPGRAWY